MWCYCIFGRIFYEFHKPFELHLPITMVGNRKLVTERVEVGSETCSRTLKDLNFFQRSQEYVRCLVFEPEGSSSKKWFRTSLDLFENIIFNQFHTCNFSWLLTFLFFSWHVFSREGDLALLQGENGHLQNMNEFDRLSLKHWNVIYRSNKMKKNGHEERVERDNKSDKNKRSWAGGMIWERWWRFG